MTFRHSGEGPSLAKRINNFGSRSQPPFQQAIKVLFSKHHSAMQRGVKNQPATTAPLPGFLERLGENNHTAPHAQTVMKSADV